MHINDLQAPSLLLLAEPLRGRATPVVRRIGGPVSEGPVLDAKLTEEVEAEVIKATIDELAATTTRQEMDNLGMTVEDGEEDDDDDDDEDDEDDGDSDEDDGDDENDD